MEVTEKIASSFRDPAGFLFHYQGELYRQINPPFQDYRQLMESGLYHHLQKEHYLISHQEVTLPLATSKEAIFIQPEKVPFISYPYEWSFSQLKDAALLTLNLQKIALEYGMTLKDASAYNVQFLRGRPIFIDTLSFTTYQTGMPWQGYRQFCQHFLAPLMLMSYRDVRLNQLLKIYIDGIPLDLASSLLPSRTRFKLSSALHIHMHAKMQKKYQGSQQSSHKQKQTKLSLPTLKRFVDSLIDTVKSLHWKIEKRSEWFDYYQANNNYSSQALNQKENIIEAWVQGLQPIQLWDLGANTGRFSSIAARYCSQVVAWDIDASCVESFYLHLKAHNHNILPLILDLTNPSPALGWGHQERDSILSRGPADAILALGLIHHLAIVNNVPLLTIAEFFSQLSHHLIIEFVPKEDSQVQKLLSSREDIFSYYTRTDFEQSFGHFFEIQEKTPLQDSERVLYLLKNKRASCFRT